ncbi:MAG TPA: Fe-Mn family superoxide dismutase [Polyangiaceae bacterium]|nr:Fe-Mn family superoxide dismutase [Polyangiaceae bacterium]
MTQARDSDLSRRDAFTTLALGGAALLAGCSSAAAPVAPEPRRGDGRPQPGTAAAIPALPGNHTPVPLPFAPGALNGLSEKLIASHHENNYGGAVKNLNRVENELAAINADTPPFIVSALRERELTFRNSKTLHEAYFGNLGGDGKRDGAIESAIASAYGTSARWEQQMRATALGLGGGSGWAILGLELDTGALRTTASGNHTQVLATSVPLLVMDLYEHSYQMDFGAAVARYIDAFFANVNWASVNARLERAQRMSALFSGKP